ncbi:MAG: hypothetical protein AAGD13_14315 [Pseudomonadota bacterium]
MKLSDMKSPVSVNLRLLDKKAEDKDGPVSFVLLDRSGQTLDRIVERDGGQFQLDPEMLGKAASVAVVPGDEEATVESVRAASKFSPDQLAELVQPNAELTLSPDIWKPLFPFTTCISGKVRKCDWWPFFLRFQADRAVSSGPLDSIRAFEPAGAILKPELNPIWQVPYLPPFLPRCSPVCNATVQIFRRTCCPRIELVPSDILDICKRLKDLIPRLPEIPKVPQIGPIPEPGPLPFPEAGIFTGGAADEVARNAERDLAALEASSPKTATEYVLARPYLAQFVYDCSEPILVATGKVGPDGKFTICFRDFPIALRAGCYIEYAFRVIQRIKGEDVTIYNGLAANAWFRSDDDICLTTYHPDARDCEELPPDHSHGDADVFLSQIGLTDSWHLHEHEQDITAPGVDPVMGLGSKTGLVGGSPDAGGRTIGVTDAPWGGTLHLKYFFPDALQATGAQYYRMSVRPISDAGVVSGTPVYLNDPITWTYDNGSDQELAYALNHPGDASFYRIPYDSFDWVGTQIHGILDTTRTDGSLHHFGKFVLTLELYTAPNAAARIVPNGALNNGAGHSTGGFEFAWRRPVGTTREVQPFIGLSHVLWWDNRKAVADITAINPTDPMSLICQFVEADGDTDFFVNFKAYCADQTTLKDWRLWYRRGLESGTTDLQTGTVNHGSVSSAPDSVKRDFATMLNGHEKCAFALNLRTEVKTWSGYGRIRSLDAYDQIAFALINATHGA